MFVRTLSILLVCLSGTAAAAAAGTSLRTGDNDIDNNNAVLLQSAKMTLFQTWTEAHSKLYSTEEELMERLKIWWSNHERIEAHNHQDTKPTYTLGHNEYSDPSHDEFAQRFRLGKYSRTPELAKEKTQRLVGISSEANAKTARRRHLNDVDVDPRLPLRAPDYVNWVTLGGVTPVKNQGACGSCWAFSTTGSLEGAKFVKTGELVSLSEQNLLDCDHQDLGCNGGLMDDAFKFDEKNGGLCSEDDYPYTAKQAKECNPMKCEDVPGSEVTAFHDVPAGEVDTMLRALAMQPVSVAIQADQFAFQFYKGGVLTAKCGEQLDHGVLAVGYGSDLETNEPYFLVKNSWGETWGEHGFIRLSRNSENENGMCGILKMASYPEVE